jgi:hypothetical protein
MVFPRVSHLFPPDAVVTRNEWPLFCPLVRMACCRCCCGGVDCEEGQQGKCCCGGVEGTCCQEGEYCCDGVCQEEPCDPPPSECEEDEDCDAGECCVGGVCQDGYCHYSVIQSWLGEGAGTCPSGWSQRGVTELGKVSCQLCETVQEAECDEQAWYTANDPGEGWSNPDPGFIGNCEPVFCGGACDPEYGCCDGCECVEIEEDAYGCVVEEPPP